MQAINGTKEIYLRRIIALQGVQNMKTRIAELKSKAKEVIDSFLTSNQLAI